MNGEYMSLETAKRIKQLETNYKNMQDSALQLDRIVKEKQQEIEKLNNIIEEYKNANEYHQNIIHELETMKQPNQLHSENVKLRAENNKLKNIINELEKELKNRIKNVPDTMVEVYEDESILNKLQELKGVDKECI